MQVDVLVSSFGALSQAIVKAGVNEMTIPNVGDITVNPGLPLANHVIQTNCCQWQGGKGEVVSIFAINLLPKARKDPRNEVALPFIVLLANKRYLKVTF